MAICSQRLTISPTQTHPPFQGGFFRLDLREVVQKNMEVSKLRDAGCGMIPPDIAELCELVHGKAECFSMLKAYFDESGIHQGSPVCLVAGFVAKTRDCGILSSNWQQVLGEYQLPYFHANEYAKKSGPFKPYIKTTFGNYGLPYREPMWAKNSVPDSRLTLLVQLTRL
jgi:hypothetical protein